MGVRKLNRQYSAGLAGRALGPFTTSFLPFCDYMSRPNTAVLTVRQSYVGCSLFLRFVNKGRYFLGRPHNC
jgi:hypothetical protein